MKTDSLYKGKPVTGEIVSLAEEISASESGVTTEESLTTRVSFLTINESETSSESFTCALSEIEINKIKNDNLYIGE